MAVSRVEELAKGRAETQKRIDKHLDGLRKRRDEFVKKGSDVFPGDYADGMTGLHDVKTGQRVAVVGGGSVKAVAANMPLVLAERAAMKKMAEEAAAAKVQESSAGNDSIIDAALAQLNGKPAPTPEPSTDGEEKG